MDCSLYSSVHEDFPGEYLSSYVSFLQVVFLTRNRTQVPWIAGDSSNWATRGPEPDRVSNNGGIIVVYLLNINFMSGMGPPTHICWSGQVHIARCNPSIEGTGWWFGLWRSHAWPRAQFVWTSESLLNSLWADWKGQTASSVNVLDFHITKKIWHQWELMLKRYLRRDTCCWWGKEVKSK